MKEGSTEEEMLPRDKPECNGDTIIPLKDEVQIYQEDFGILYKINDTPSWYFCFILGMQHYLTMFGGTFLIAVIVMGSMCLENHLDIQTQILGSVFFVMGICTFLQSTFGIRLPIIQGCTASLLFPTLTTLNLPTLAPCSSENESLSYENSTDFEPLWQTRIRLASGMIMVASLFQFIIGMSGLMSVLLRYIGPLAISPTITLIGLSLFPIAGDMAKGQWYIALMTCFLIILFTFYLYRVQVPMLWWTQKKKFQITWHYFFRSCPVILAVLISWIICAILTATNVLPSDPDAWGYKARTDIRIDVIREAAWFRIPYPLQFGIPTVTASSVLGFVAGVICSVVESVGDYHATAKVAGAPPPAKFAINRGISMEGVGCFLAGFFGCPVGTTSYSDNIGAIGMTRVASRRVIQWAALVMIFFGLFNKFGALFVSLPEPIIGGLFLTMFGLLTGVGLSNMQYVNLNSSRNLLILGLSIFAGLMIPTWVKANRDNIDLGVPVLSETVIVLLSINMFVGGVTGLVLDNTMPGTVAERGLIAWRTMAGTDGEEECTEATNRKTLIDVYDLKIYQKLFKKITWLRYVPICPTYTKYSSVFKATEEPSDMMDKE